MDYPNLVIKPAKMAYLSQIMLIINDAKALLRQSGSLQWNLSDGYPNEQTLINDINNNQCYVCFDGETICGIYVLLREIDHNYDVIYDGSWLTKNSTYYSIHRIAVKKAYYHSNVASFMINHAIKEAKLANIASLKADTHELNIPMQKLLIKNGFIQTGIIHLQRVSEDSIRLAYEKIL